MTAAGARYDGEVTPGGLTPPQAHRKLLIAMDFPFGTILARRLHRLRRVWAQLPLVVSVALGLVAISCIIPLEPEYRDAGPPNSPPYIDWDAVLPPFYQAQSLLASQHPSFTVTAADIDLGQELLVRFCYQQNAEDPKHVINTYPVGASSDGKPTRKPVVTEGFALCQPAGMTGAETHFLFVVVTDGAFKDAFDCEAVSAGSGVAKAFWSYTCQQ